MNKLQLILLFSSLVLVVIIYQLPRSVVENDQLQEVTNQPQDHSFDIPGPVQLQITSLRTSINNAGSSDKKTNFAHSLANVYLDYGVLDSAIWYAEAIETWTEQPSYEAADIYFTAFERSSNADQGTTYAGKAKAILTALLEKDPENLLLKNRLAMTLVASENPMAGISMLREILATDETNRQAILNLGLLSIQSGQYDRAQNRFETLVSLDTSDHEAKLYLAVSMIELDQPSQARLLLEEILASGDSIPAIKVMANDYLEAL